MSTRISPTPGIVVCVPTYRRPAHLRLTLDSLARQRTGRRFAVVVAENEAEAREGAAVAQAVFAEGHLAGRVVVEARQGNCHAINAAFATALRHYGQARHILMMDDDEIADPDWLEAMVAAAERTGAGIVGGPVHPRLMAGARQALARHPAFLPAYAASGPVPMIYGSGNCLITRETFERLGLPAFDVGYNFLGGGDTDFFTRARRVGIRFHWAEDAVIGESVPEARLHPRWLAARGLRIGAINHRIEAKHAEGRTDRARLALKSAVLLPFSGLRALHLLVRTREPMIALHPIFVALGRCFSALGIEPEPYRAGASPEVPR